MVVNGVNELERTRLELYLEYAAILILAILLCAFRSKYIYYYYSKYMEHKEKTRLTFFVGPTDVS